MVKAFVSYHHANDQGYKEYLGHMADAGAFEDISVRVGEIDDRLDNQRIRQIIRDDYLRDSEVTILLCGPDTQFRKHIDWELKSSMIDGKINKRSAILVIDLPESGNSGFTTSFPDECAYLYPDFSGDLVQFNRSQYEEQYPDLPERIIDNLVHPLARISVVPWETATRNVQTLRTLIDAVASTATTNQYDLSRPMRMRNYNRGGDRALTG